MKGEGRDGRHELSPQRAAFAICSDVIAGPTPTATEIPKRDALLTTRWPHHELHDIVPGLPVHVIGTYYGASAARSWRIGRMRLSGVARPGGVSVIPAGWSGHWDIVGRSPVSYVMLSNSACRPSPCRSIAADLSNSALAWPSRIQGGLRRG